MNKHSLESPVCLVSLLLTLAGCTEHVVGGVEPDGSQAAGAGPAATAVAILGANMPSDPEGFLSNSQISVQADTLYVFIGNAGQTCGNPFMPFGCDPNPYMEWQFVLGIPSALQVPGALSLPTGATVTGVDNVVELNGSTGGDDSSCSAGSAPNALQGDIAISSIDATQVTLDFTGVMPQAWIGATLPVFNAEYVASRCP